MALKDLMVYVDGGPRAQAVLDAAIHLAAAHEAHLVGVYVKTHPHIPNYVRSMITEDVLRRQSDLIEDAARGAEQMFKDRAGGGGIRAEWRRVEGQVLPLVALHARYCDVAVVGQSDPSGENGGTDLEIPDRLILSLGRPVLVIPAAGEFPLIGHRVMVAWDAGRPATRAVNDALPFLERARHVSVVAVNPTEAGEEHGDIPSADICLHLARHGINAEAQHVFTDDVDVADMLLSRAADQAIDLFVMGAYGHARWRELVLGGVTRHMLSHMTMPVLMSH
jgi:nucleotide-binding universal stress UspA family protein